MSIVENNDKRQTVRVNSRILFAAKPISKEQYDKVKLDFNNGITIYNREELVDVRMFVGTQSSLAKIRERDEDMATFLQHIDAKIDMLLRETGKIPSVVDSLKLQDVNIGGNGLAFWSSEVYRKGDLLEFHIVLPCENVFLDCFGQVVKCQKDINAGQTCQRVSVSFVLIMEQDREELIQYNFRQQSLALKRRRMEKGGQGR